MEAAGILETGIRVSLDAPLAHVRIDNPSRRNAMSQAMWRDLARACADLAGDARVRAVIVEGEGGHFCAGADISEFDAVFAHPESTREYLADIERGLTALNQLARPTLAKVRGSTFGGGLALALACDLRIADDGASFCAPPAKLGLVYGPAETRLLVEAVGAARAKDLLMTARTVGAAEAARLGLVTELCAASDLDARTLQQARALCQLSATSLRGAKAMIGLVAARDGEAARELVAAAAMGRDFREGRAAFREKRRAQFDSET